MKKPSDKSTSPATLEVEGIVAGYDRATVLRGVSLSVTPGRVTALFGPTGAGKTTLLRTISGLIRPTAGEIRLEGANVTSMPAHERTELGLCQIAEGRSVFKRLTVRENLVMQSEKGREKDAIERAAAVFPVLGERLSQMVGTLSGGEQQMLAMARAYVSKPRVILVDEPSLGLAPRLVDNIFEFLGSGLVAERGVGVLVVDQFIGRVLQMALQAYVMSRGQIVLSGTADEVRSSELVAHYLSASG